MGHAPRTHSRKGVLVTVFACGLVAVVMVAVVAACGGASGSAQPPFPSYGAPLPASYRGPQFHLSQDYPTTAPSSSDLPVFYKTDFKKNWKMYLLQARSYCLAGNIATNWEVQRNPVRRWYNMPWQHYGQFGREGIDGLTKEAPIAVKQLAPTQTLAGVTYAIGFYNPAGGYTIGQVWKNHDAPDLSAARFANGTVMCKLLFANLPTENVAAQVPSLVNPIQWSANVTIANRAPTKTPKISAFDSCLAGSQYCARAIRKVTLIQMDLMAKDDRAPTHWIFGTFQYNGTLNHKNHWLNLVPVGLMWGNDPENDVNASNPTPVKTIINRALKETVINPDATELPPTHLGWNSRLNGPVDNPQSSCMSCHMTAELSTTTHAAPYPILPMLFTPGNKPAPKPGSKEWMLWFRSVFCTTPFDPNGKTDKVLATDDSLQLAESIQNFYIWRDTMDGVFPPPPTVAALNATLRAGVYPIVSGYPSSAKERVDMLAQLANYLQRPGPKS
jgi:hypothetical protein